MRKKTIPMLAVILLPLISTGAEGGKPVPLVAAEKSPAPQTESAQANQDFKANIYVSLQNPNMQWWYNLPPSAIPHISQIKKIFVNQKFSVFSFVDKASVVNGDFDVTYSINLIDEQGNRERILEPTVFKGKKPSRDVILACPDIMTATFSEKYKTGKYTFEILAVDNLTDKTSVSTTSADFAKWIAPEPFKGAKLVTDYVAGFYAQPSPETLYSIFFSKDFNLEQKGAPNSLNYCYIGFLKTAFKNNHFLIDYIRDNFNGYTPEERAKIIFLMAICGGPKLDKGVLTEKERDYQERIFAASFPDPYKGWDKVLGAAQMDMLFGEFFADGTYTPIRKVMDLLAFADEAAFAEEAIAQKKKPEAPEEREKFLLGILNRTALYSLLRRSEQDPLIESYCIWAAMNNDIPPQASKEFKPFFEEGKNSEAELKSESETDSKVELKEVSAKAAGSKSDVKVAPKPEVKTESKSAPKADSQKAGEAKKTPLGNVELPKIDVK